MATPNLNEIVSEVATEFPGFKLVYKKDSFWMKFLNVLILIGTFGQMKFFMVNFTTTLGRTMYLPSAWDTWQPFDQCAVVRHERVHLRQSRTLGKFKFFLEYACWPLPILYSKGRTNLEKEAYTETMRAWYEYGLDLSTQRDQVVGFFVSSDYGWMWPFKNEMDAWYDATVKQVEAGG